MTPQKTIQARPLFSAHRVGAAVPPSTLTSAAAAQIAPVHPDLTTNGVVRGTLLPLDERFPDAFSIVRYLAALTFEFSQAVALKEFVDNVLLAPLLNNDRREHLDKVVDFVRRHVIYVADPAQAEYIKSPVVLLDRIRRSGRAYGDCDDHVLLLNAMLASVGFTVRPVAVKLGASKVFNHVVTEVLFEGDWRTIDPCHKSGGADPVYRDKLIP